MVKTRVQLSAIVFVLGYIGYLFLANMINGGGLLPAWKAVLMYLDVTFLTTAVGILICTFIRAKQLANGSVCFMPNHPLVKLGFVTKNGTNLCPTFWQIGLIITCAGMVALLTIESLIFAIMAAIKGEFVEVIGLPLLATVAFVGVFALFAWLASKDFWLLKVPVYVFVSLLAIIFLYLLPMGQIEKSYHITLNSGEDWIVGTMIYLKWLGIIVAVVGGATAMIYLTFKHWGAVSSSWLGKQISLLKEKLCVRFVECPGS